jgi:tRNA G18 (ribose-2'-O)-methylase SpoU
MALVPPLEMDAEAAAEALAPLRNDLSVAICNPGNAFAVGAIIRVAHSFLVREIIVVGDGSWYEKASMGMQRFERVVQVADEAALQKHVAGRPLWAVEKEHATRELWCNAPYPADVVLVFGSERFGVPPSILAAASEIVGIPMFGINHSFPVTVAVGIVLADWARRRYTNALVLPKNAGAR